MAQIRWKNISEKAQTFHFSKLIELLQCDKYFLNKVKICQLGHLIHVHHGNDIFYYFKAPEMVEYSDVSEPSQTFFCIRRIFLEMEL